MKFSKCLIHLSNKNLRLYLLVTVRGNLRHVEKLIRLDLALETGAETRKVCLREGICIYMRPFNTSSCH